MTSQSEEVVDAAIEDLKKYAEKINAMMKVSIEGDAPAIMKIILFSKMADFALKQYKGSDKFDEAEALVDKFIKLCSNGFKIMIKEKK